jgi:hypothetical protein
MGLERVIEKAMPLVIGSALHVGICVSILDKSEGLQGKLTDTAATERAHGFRESAAKLYGRLKYYASPKRALAVGMSLIPDLDIFFSHLGFLPQDLRYHRSPLTHSAIIGLPFTFALGTIVGALSGEGRSSWKRGLLYAEEYGVGHLVLDIVQSGTLSLYPLMPDMKFSYPQDQLMNYGAQILLFAGIALGPVVFERYVKPSIQRFYANSIAPRLAARASRYKDKAPMD